MQDAILLLKKSALVGLLSFLVVLAVWLAASSRFASEPGTMVEGTPQGSSLMEVRGLSFSTYVDDQLASRIQTDQLLVKPRQFGVFRVKSVNEAVLVNSRFEFHAPGEKAAAEAEDAARAVDFGQSIDGLAQLRGVGRLTQVVISGMSMVYHQDQEASLRMLARQATLDLTRGQSLLEEVVIECLTAGKRIHATQAVWDRDTQRFVIPGSYRLMSPGEAPRPGSGISVGLDGEVQELPRNKFGQSAFSG